MAEQLEEVRKALTPRAIMFGLRGGTMGGCGDPFINVAAWYPYELMALLHDATSNMHRLYRNSSPRGRSGRFTSLSQILRIQPSWQVDSRLMIDYAVSSGDKSLFPPITAAEFVSEFVSEFNSTSTGGFGRGGGTVRELTSNYVKPHLVRHPQFADVVTQWMEQTQDQTSVELAFELWSKVWSEKQTEAKLRLWLKSGDATHTRAAMQILASRDALMSSGELASDVSEAIDRLAETQSLNARDLYYLDSLGDKAPDEASHAIRFLTFWLDNPEERAEQTELAGLGTGVSALHHCVNILVRSPERAREMDVRIQEAIKDWKDPDGYKDKSGAELRRLWEFLSETPE
jgi:hypothetical protein